VADDSHVKGTRSGRKGKAGSDGEGVQKGRTLKKKRANQPIDMASPCAPRLRDSMRALATWVEGTTLPGRRWRGSTTPEKRSTSTLPLTPICFSPTTSRWPLGSTCCTVAVMLPWKVLLLVVLPSPEKLLSLLAPSVALFQGAEPPNSGMALMPAEASALRSMEAEELWLAFTRSVIWMVT